MIDIVIAAMLMPIVLIGCAAIILSGYAKPLLLYLLIFWALCWKSWTGGQSND